MYVSQRREESTCCATAGGILLQYLRMSRYPETTDQDTDVVIPSYHLLLHVYVHVCGSLSPYRCMYACTTPCIRPGILYPPRQDVEMHVPITDSRYYDVMDPGNRILRCHDVSATYMLVLSVMRCVLRGWYHPTIPICMCAYLCAGTSSHVQGVCMHVPVVRVRGSASCYPSLG